MKRVADVDVGVPGDFFCSRGSLTPVAAPNVSPNDF